MSTGEQLSVADCTKTTDVVQSPPPVEGYYLFMIVSVKWVEKAGCEVIELLCRGGTTSGQVDKKVPLFLKRTDAGAMTEKHQRFALAARLIEPGKVANVDIAWFKRAEGQLIVAQVDSYIDSSKKKRYAVADFGLALWGVTDEDVPAKVADMDGYAAEDYKTIVGGGLPVDPATEFPPRVPVQPVPGPLATPAAVAPVASSPTPVTPSPTPVTPSPTPVTPSPTPVTPAPALSETPVATPQPQQPAPTTGPPPATSPADGQGQPEGWGTFK